MNQGGGGQWPAIKYSEFNVILLAESTVRKESFDMVWASGTEPPMSIQEVSGSVRQLNGITDLDVTAEQVRPVVTFLTRDQVRVVFVHLKSGNERVATQALTSAIVALKAKCKFTAEVPTLWIGDFNRADDAVLLGLGAKVVFAGGGYSSWDLDRAYVSGSWRQDYMVTPITRSALDHNHAGIAFRY